MVFEKNGESVPKRKNKGIIWEKRKIDKLNKKVVILKMNALKSMVDEIVEGMRRGDRVVKIKCPLNIVGILNRLEYLGFVDSWHFDDNEYIKGPSYEKEVGFYYFMAFVHLQYYKRDKNDEYESWIVMKSCEPVSDWNKSSYRGIYNISFKIIKNK